MNVGAEVTLRVMSESDLDEISQLVVRLGWPHRPEDVALFMRLGQGRIAREDSSGRFMGVAMWWTFGDQLARLGLVMIQPEAQGQGLGRRLVEQVLKDANELDMVLLATDAGLPLYEKLGFQTIGGNRQVQGPYSGEPLPDPAIRPASVEDLSAVTALDARAFGAERTETIRTLTEVGRTFVLTDQGHLTGYAIERDFGRGSTVGPIVAPSEADAIRLFRAAARPGFTRVDCPADADHLRSHLEASGLVSLEGVSPVMVLGNWRPPTGGAQVYALSSHALG